MSYLQSRPVTITHRTHYVRIPSTWYARGYTHRLVYTVLVHVRAECVAVGEGDTLATAVRMARHVTRLRRLEPVYYMRCHGDTRRTV